MTRALVLGGAGFIGTAACKELMRRGVETIAAGRRDRPYGTFTSYVAFDRDEEPQLQRALESVQPDVVLDLACYKPKQVEAMIRSFAGQREGWESEATRRRWPGPFGRPDRNRGPPTGRRAADTAMRGWGMAYTRHAERQGRRLTSHVAGHTERCKP